MEFIEKFVMVVLQIPIIKQQMKHVMKEIHFVHQIFACKKMKPALIITLKLHQEEEIFLNHIQIVI